MNYLLGLTLALLLFSFDVFAQNKTKHVDMMIVLAVDVSPSVDKEEYELQKKGIVDTLLNEDLYDILEQCNFDGIAITYVEWSGSAHKDEQAVQKVAWTHIKNRDDLVGFSQKIIATQRLSGSSTDIEQALYYSYELLTQPQPFSTDRKIIFLSSDGPQNVVPKRRNSNGSVSFMSYDIMADMLAPTRNLIASQDISIQALVITNEVIDQISTSLDKYFEQNVIAGPTAFVRKAKSYKDYQSIFLEMLMRELNRCVS